MIKRIALVLFAVVLTVLAYSQTNIQDGDRCFDNGDYACAITQYNEAFKTATGKDKQIAKIKLTRAKWCSEHTKTANQAFNNKNYTIAKDEYQKILDSNPKDSYAQSQLGKCKIALNLSAPPASNSSNQPPKLRKATTAELTDIWNNKYGVQPQRCQNLINAGIDADDAQRRINTGEGKPQGKEKQATSLSLSKTNLHFYSYGETSEQITVYSDASTYSVPQSYIPSWCTVNTYSGYFTVTANANPNYTSQKDWFKVTAGGKEIKVYVEQLGKTETTLRVAKESIYFSSKGGGSEQIKIYSNTGTYSVTSISSWCRVQKNDGYIVISCNNNESNTHRKSYFNVVSGDKSKRIYVTQGGKNDCFNCPQTDNKWGVTLGYAQLNSLQALDGVQFGLRFEPLFKYGFGLNTGINIELYSSDLLSFKEYYADDYSSVDLTALNIPLHLEYRLNFPKKFNLFGYGGVGFNVLTNSDFDTHNLPATLEYGGGLRINHLQFSVGQSLYMGDWQRIQDFRIGRNQAERTLYQNLVLSLSYMF